MSGMDIRELKAIVEWASLTEGVRELSLKMADVELFVSKNERVRDTSIAPALVAPAVAQVVQDAAPIQVPVAAPVAATAGDTSAEVGTLAAGEVVVKAPMVGTFYASSQPGAPSFVQVGDTVQADTVLCIVEVMKLMNNVEAGAPGTVTRVLVENEAAVEYGQPLFVIQHA